MSEQKTAAQLKAERIAAARAELARRYREDPEGVARFEARMAKLTAAAKRERERVDILVLGANRPPPVTTQTKVRGKRRSIKVPARLAPDVDRALKVREAYSPWNGTPETLAHAERTHQGALAQLVANETINAEELEWAAQIANVHRSISSGVEVAVASLEARVDQSARAPAVAERIHRVRMHAAYTLWRSTLPVPRCLVLDMIVGDAVGYSVAARRYRVHNRKAKRLLIEAIRRWPLCVMHVFAIVDQRVVDAMNMARDPGLMLAPVRPEPPAEAYRHARAMEEGRERTDEPYLLPPIDPAFLDERGYFRPWEEIAAIVRDRAFGGAPDTADE